MQLGLPARHQPPADFGLLSAGPSPSTFAAVPVLMLAAPFLIMRNTLLGRRQEGRRFEFVFLATLIAGFWSLMSGLVLVMTLRACGMSDRLSYFQFSEFVANVASHQGDANANL